VSGVAAPLAADVERFRDLIRARLGLQFEDARLGFLAEILWRRLHATGRSCADYLDELESRSLRTELGALAPELTVPETYFFRHTDQLRAFADVVVPARMKARGVDRRLWFLSAGCASGEEAFTLAMILRELPLDPGWVVSIRAVDVNQVVLDRAARGHFSPWSLRETPPDAQRRWFRSSGRELVLDDAIRSQVTFEQRNLSVEDPELWRPDAYDAVFCRNVLMYFAPETAQAVVARIARSIAPGGHLFLGHAETLRGKSHDFHLCHSHSAFYYQRREAGEPAGPPARWAHIATEPPPFAAPPLERAPDGCWVEAIDRASDRIRDLFDEQRRGGAPRGGEAAPAPEPPRFDLRTPLELLGQERFGEALRLVQALPPESAVDPDARLLEAVLLAHSGQLVRASQVCAELLQIDELNAGAHYVLALCCAGSGDSPSAAEHDQVASYLDPDFAMPRLHLGLLARRAGDHAQARRELRQALDLLQREEPSRLLFFGGGFNRDALVALCRAELVACGGRG
jgi:chemotaxis protein methyltransferase CheR